MKKLLGKKEIQKRRKMRHFIDAADEIIAEKGIDAVTIRGVSEIAGYNSATLYNYFSNLDHLIYYTVMKHIPMFDHALKPVSDLSGNSLDTAEIMWREFCKIAYEYLEVVHILMFSPYAKDFSKVLHEYFELYRDKFGASEDDELETLFKHSIFDAVLNELKAFENKLNLSEEDSEELNTFVLTYFQGHLVRRMTIDADVSLNDYLNRMVRFMNHIIWSYSMKPQQT